MSGYRQHRYDPNAYEQPGPPLKPYNWVQWMGVAIGGVGVALIILHAVGRMGLIPRWIDDFSAGPIILLVVGSFLINSRRAPAAQAGDEQLAKNRRLLLITVGICAAVIGFAAAIEFSGA